MSGLTKTVLGRYLLAAGDLLLPRHCCVCGEELLTTEKLICLCCLADLPLTWHWTSIQNEMADRFNKWISDEYIPYIYAVSLFRFSKDNNYTKICYSLKYHRAFSIGRYFSRMLANKMKSSSWFSDLDLVVPVPLHWTRKITRGYNQAEVIAAELAAVLDLPLMPNLLVRRRKTETQTKLGIEAKRSNVQGAFVVNEKQLNKLQQLGSGVGLLPTCAADSQAAPRPFHILLVDDLFTTGATTYNCYKALRERFGNSIRISIACLASV